MDIRLTPEKERMQQQASLRLGRPKEDLVQEALDRYLEYDHWFEQCVEAGQVAARSGQVIDHEDLVARIERRFAS